MTSICKDPTSFKPKTISKVEFKRISDIYDGITLLDKDKISPLDIKQGNLGDCYLLSALSVLAEKPFLIYRLFEIREFNDVGIYCVWLCVDGEWKWVYIDDFIPCIGHTPWFSKGTNTQVWVPLIEKAYAKVFGKCIN